MRYDPTPDPVLVMASTWIRTRPNEERAASATASSSGPVDVRHPLRYGGSFKTMREAKLRRDWIAGELAASGCPTCDSSQAQRRRRRRSADAAARWQAVARRRRRGDRRAAPHRAQPGAADARRRPRRRDHRAGRRRPRRATPRRREGARVDPQDADRARDGARPRGRHTEPGPRPRDRQAAARGAGGAQPADRRARRSRVPARSRRSTGWRCSSSTGAAPACRAIDTRSSATTTSRAAACGLRAATTKTRRALWVELHPVLADALEATLGPREDRDPEARLFAGSAAPTRSAPSIAKACRAAGDPAVVAARPAAPAHLAAAPARRAVGADRRVRRAAQPHRDREHLHARARRRDRGRLRGAARPHVSGRCCPRCCPRSRKSADMQPASSPVPPI